MPLADVQELAGTSAKTARGGPQDLEMKMAGGLPMMAQCAEAEPFFGDIYHRLKAMASRHRRRNGAPSTLCTTELVHEAYLRVGDMDNRFAHEAKFFAYAARAMRHILTDAARRRLQPMRGGDWVRLDLADPLAQSVNVDPQMALQLDEALTALEREDSRAAQVVELHYFCGLDLRRIAELLDLNRHTVGRDWNYARAFLAARAQE